MQPRRVQRRAWGPRRPRTDGCGGVCGCVAWRKIHAGRGRGALSIFAKNQVKIKGKKKSAFLWKSERRFSAFRNFACCSAPHEARGPGRLCARSRSGNAGSTAASPKRSEQPRGAVPGMGVAASRRAERCPGRPRRTASTSGRFRGTRCGVNAGPRRLLKGRVLFLSVPAVPWLQGEDSEPPREAPSRRSPKHRGGRVGRPDQGLSVGSIGEHRAEFGSRLLLWICDNAADPEQGSTLLVFFILTSPV